MARNPKPDRQLAQVLAAIQNQVGPGRSPLYRWMRQRHDALADAFTEAPPAWSAFASAVAAIGLTDADGKPPTAEGARQTWYRVRRDVAAARARRLAKSAPALAPGEIAPGVRAAAPVAEPDTPRPRMALDIRPARALADLPAPPPAPPADAAPAPSSAGPPAPSENAAPAQDAAEQMRRVFAAMEAGTTPMPKVMP